MSHLKVRERADRPGTFQITGTVPGYDRLRQTAKSTTKKLANEEAAILEARMLREAFHGKPNGRADRWFAEIAEAYLNFEDRHPAQEARVVAVSKALGDIKASAVTQDVVDGLRATMFKRTSKPARNSIKAFIVMPISVVLNFGWRRGWCNKVGFELPKESAEEKESKRPKVLLPVEAWALVDAAVPHLQPILMTMFGIGSRVAETLNIDWKNVDLMAGRVSYIQKGGRWRHGVLLPPAVVTALANLPGPREGKVFLNTRGRGTRGRHAYKPRLTGGQIRSGFIGALKRAGLSGRDITPHDCRHSYASWHMAIWKNPLKLKVDGGWDSTATLEIYMHLIPEGHEAEILKFWGYRVDDTKLAPSIREILLSA
jgi:integrase